MRRIPPGLGPLLLGLGLAVASHPAVAAFFGQEGASRPLTVGRLAELALNHVTLAATGLAVVTLLGVGLGLIATRARFAPFRGSIDTLAAFAQAVPLVVVVALALPVLHNARNALAAAAAVLAAGLPLSTVQAGLAAFRGVKGRLQLRAGPNGSTLLDDTYNANPDSMRAGIDVLAATVGRKILVLGDMGEIGEMTGQFHDEIGGYAKSQGVDRLFAFGESSLLAARNFGAGGMHYKKLEDLIEALLPELTPDSTVLVKGSRFMRMERVADAIEAAAQTTPPENA